MPINPDTLTTPVPFREALEYALGRKVELPGTYYGARPNAQRSQAFSIAGATEIAQVQAVLDSLNKQLASGVSFKDWVAKVKAGEMGLDLPLGRLDNIFRTNIQAAYNSGRYAQQMANVEYRPYWMYDAINDTRTRPTHLAMDNIVLPYNHSWWQTHYPPNGYRCRCTVISLSEAQAKRRGISRTPPSDAAPDKGFDYNPGEEYAKGPDRALAKAVEKLPAAEPMVAKVKVEALSRAPSLEEVKARGKQLGDAIRAEAEWGIAEGKGMRAVVGSTLHANRVAGIIEKRIKEQGKPLPAAAYGFLGDNKHHMMDAMARMPRYWQQELAAYTKNSRPLTSLSGSENKGRGFFSPTGFHWGKGNAMVVSGGANNRSTTWTHEMSHAVQWAAPQVDRLFQAYHRERTAGERLVHLGKNYDSNEVTRKDKYFDAYVGKEYDIAGYAEKTSAELKTLKGYGNALELMSMGTEYVLSGDPSRLMKIMKDDPGFFDFVLGMVL